MQWDYLPKHAGLQGLCQHPSQSFQLDSPQAVQQEIPNQTQEDLRVEAETRA